MLNYYSIYNNSLYQVNDKELKAGLIEPVWIDVINPTPDEAKLFTSIFNISFTENNLIQEIRLPSCYYQEKGEVYAKINIVKGNIIEQMSIILTNDKIITTQSEDAPENKMYLNYIISKNQESIGPNGIFAYLIESRLNEIDNNLKIIHDSLDNLSKITFYDKHDNGKYHSSLKDNISIIGKNGHLTATHNESLMSISKALDFISKSKQIKVSNEEHEKFNDLVSQVSALNSQLTILNDKISFLLDITFGLLDLQQNAISKVLSIAALIFLPPAIIAGMYGMNFNKIPLSNSDFGFEIATLVMVLSACLPYLFCKLKRWI